MEIYKNIDGDSNIAEYETGIDFIIVKFKDGAKYLYNYFSAGDANIEQMKILASIGNGLNSYINRNVKKLYARKWC